MASPANQLVHQFSREETANNYHNLQCRYLENNNWAIQQGQLKLFTRTEVQHLIEEVLSNNVDLNQYGVIYIKHKRHLTLKDREDPSKYRIVVPYEECFDIVLEVHRIFGHRGASKESYKYLSKNYVVDKVWLALIAEACNFCESRRRTEVREIDTDPQRFKECYRIFSAVINKTQTKYIDPYTSVQHNNYRALLIVVDKFTNFMCLKPLTAYDDNNVAVELFKVFSDHGIPKMLETSDVPFYESVCTKMATFLPTCQVPVRSIPVPHTDWSAMVVAYLQDWMDLHNNQNWVLGCQSVQWNLNNTVREGSTPFLDVYKSAPIQDLMDAVVHSSNASC